MFSGTELANFIPLHPNVRSAAIRRAIALIMEAEITSQTSVYFYQATRRNISEDNHLYNRRCEKMKSHFRGNCWSGNFQEKMSLAKSKAWLRG
jgi:hypothetical protein